MNGTYFVYGSKTINMELQMFLNGQLIDAEKIYAHQLNQSGQIEILKMKMEEKHEDILDLSDHEPQFFIDTVPSSMNSKKFRKLN